MIDKVLYSSIFKFVKGHIFMFIDLYGCRLNLLFNRYKYSNDECPFCIGLNGMSLKDTRVVRFRFEMISKGVVETHNIVAGNIYDGEIPEHTGQIAQRKTNIII
jgi:hypothetical protein